jgi:hypothetical protein
MELFSQEISKTRLPIPLPGRQQHGCGNCEGAAKKRETSQVGSHKRGETRTGVVLLLKNLRAFIIFIDDVKKRTRPLLMSAHGSNQMD